MWQYEFEVPIEGDDVSPSFPSGTNIKTACYGLLLVALDQCNDDDERKALNRGLEALDELSEDALAVSFQKSWPWTGFDQEGLIGLAVVLDDLSTIGWDEIAAEAEASIDAQIEFLEQYLEDNSHDEDSES